VTNTVLQNQRAGPKRSLTMESNKKSLQSTLKVKVTQPRWQSTKSGTTENSLA